MTPMYHNPLELDESNLYEHVGSLGDTGKEIVCLFLLRD